MKRATALIVVGLSLLVTTALLLRRAPGEGRPAAAPAPRPTPGIEAPVSEPVADAPAPAPKPAFPSAPAPAPAASIDPPPGVDPLQTGFVRGSVRIVGPVPPRKRLRVDADPRCAALQAGVLLSEDVVADEGGFVQGAFVYLSRGLNGPAPLAPVASVYLDQVGCRYVPHVLGVQVGQPLVVLNSDNLLHSVHASALNNKGCVIGMPAAGQEHVERFTCPEIMVRIRCDVHPWMSAWVGVLDHPYFAVTAEKGGYGIPKLPPGRYIFKVWHEKYADVEREVDVGPGAEVVLDFLLDARKP